MVIPPLAILAIGIFTVIGLILFLRINAFIALIVAALVVSVLAPQPPVEQKEAGVNKVNRVAIAFGESAGKIGIVIALAAVIGQCMMESGAADRVVRFFVGILGQKRAPVALMGSRFVLSVPVFFDTVLYLLVPLARSLYTRTKQNYLLYIMAIVAGGAVTHTLVPPTPGPLVLAATLKIDLGMMIMMGIVVGLPTSIAGLAYAALANRLWDIPMRQVGNRPDPEPIPDERLPSLTLSLLPVILPVILISSDTVAKSLAKQAGNPNAAFWQNAVEYTSLIGDSNLALLLSTVIAVLVYVAQRKPTKEAMSEMVETSLMSGGVIILITAGGGAFGAMLKTAEIGTSIKEMFQGDAAGSAGLMLLFLGFGVSALLKIAQGSSTVAMITASGMLASMVSGVSLGYHPVYLGTAIGAGSLIGSWMNDSGFWIFAKMGGLTELEALKTWTVLLAVLGVTSMAVTVLLAMLFPLVSAV